jgi:uncharacterized protein
MSAATGGKGRQPWYREPWPWLLMAGPAIVVVAGIVTAWIAVVHEDGLVADDYYKQGLAINQVIRRDAAAAAQNIAARVMFGEGRVRVLLTGPATMPAELVLRLVHRTRAGLDREARLVHGGGGWYEGDLVRTASGRWHLLLEDGERGWRLTGDWDAAAGDGMRLAARARPGDPQ